MCFSRILFPDPPLFLNRGGKGMVNKISAAELANVQARGWVQLIDIRSPAEYASGHVPGAINIPMEQIGARIADLRIASPVVLICRSGQRACATAQLLKTSRVDVLVLDGGTRAWKESGGQIVVNNPTGWSFERRVRIGAGLLALVGVVLSLVWNRAWIGLSAFVGLGLTLRRTNGHLRHSIPAHADAME
jgi:rhodanese-related sulfurtransferase